MPRTALAIHVIEKNQSTENLRKAKGKVGLWETGYWVIGDATAQTLIGGRVYVHRGQKVPSHAGGTIVDIYHEPGSDLKRRVIVFKSEPDAMRVVAEPPGWGNERKLVWKTDPSLPVQVLAAL